MSLSKKVAKRMRAIREGLGLTQTEVSEKMGLIQSHYSQLETTRAGKITVDKIEVFCTAYKVNPQWLFGNDVRIFLSDDLENTIGRKIRKKEKPPA